MVWSNPDQWRQTSPPTQREMLVLWIWPGSKVRPQTHTRSSPSGLQTLTLTDCSTSAWRYFLSAIRKFQNFFHLIPDPRLGRWTQPIKKSPCGPCGPLLLFDAADEDERMMRQSRVQRNTALCWNVAAGTTPVCSPVQIMWPRYRSVVIHQCSSRTGSNGRCIDRILWVWFLRLVEVKPFWRSLKKHFHWLKIHTSHFLQLSGWGVYWNLSELCLNYNLKKWSTLFKELMIEKRKYISRRYTQM